jgi:hypothetical protein
MLGMATVVLLVGLAAPVDGDQPQGCSGFDVRVQAAQGQLPGVERGFSAAAAKDIQIVVTAPRELEERQLQLWLYTPSGHLYQAMRVPTTPARAGGDQASPAGVGQLLYLSASWMRVTLTLPVSGTLITSNGLYGSWRVEPHLDRAPRRCADGVSFVLQP